MLEYGSSAGADGYGAAGSDVSFAVDGKLGRAGALSEQDVAAGQVVE